MNLDKLKEVARRHELREEWRKAIDTYRSAAERLANAGEAQDPSIYNRVGDLELKAGNHGAAVEAYEQAAHVYADQGFFNNAIALCGKILRVDPRRTAVYLHLAELHAEKNVIGEATRNAAEYYRRMQSEERGEEAVATLRRFGSRFAASTELRSAVAALLTDAAGDGLTGLEEGEGAKDSAGPSGVSEEPRTPTGRRAAGSGLVFLDTGLHPSPTEDDTGGGELAVLPESAEVEIETPASSRVEGFEPTLLEAPAVEESEEITLTLEADDLDLLEIGEETEVDGAERWSGEALFDAIEVEAETEPATSEGGHLAALEARLAAFEMEGRWTEAYAVALELSQLDPGRVFRHQKKVELAYQTGQRDLLIASYLGLADSLRGLGAETNAQVVYQRVLEHDPQNPQALAALAEQSEAPGTGHGSATGQASPQGDYVDLGALILDTEAPRDTRMRVEQEEPVREEDVDFLETLAQFKEGLAANVDASDYQTHYDLGIAFKEMGLLDEAIAQFQKALATPGGHLRSAEALGIAFFEKGQFGVAEAVLHRAIETLAEAEGEKIGLLYWMGRAVEAQGRPEQAARWYERAMAVDIMFEDVSDRLARLVEGGGP